MCVQSLNGLPLRRSFKFLSNVHVKLEPGWHGVGCVAIVVSSPKVNLLEQVASDVAAHKFYMGIKHPT